MPHGLQQSKLRHPFADSPNKITAEASRGREGEGESPIPRRDEADGVSVTTDAWKSNQKQSYATYSCHFVHKTQGKFVTCVLETAAFPGHHTAVNIASHATAAVKKFDVQDQVIACVHDSAANIECADRQLESDEGWISLTCSAHKLQTCISHVIKDLPSVHDLLAAA